MGAPAESASGPKPTVPRRPSVIAVAIRADLTSDLTAVCIQIDRAVCALPTDLRPDTSSPVDGPGIGDPGNTL